MIHLISVNEYIDGCQNAFLMGADAGPEARLSAVMLTAAIGGAVMHPLAADLDDDTLRSQLLHLARRFLSLPD